MGIKAASTPGFDLVLNLLPVVFVLTAALGVWAAYDREAALGKFGLIVGAVALYYLMAWFGRRRPWRAAALLALVGVVLAGWVVVSDPDLDQAAGVLAILAPLPLALAWRGWQSRRPAQVGLSLAGLGLVLFGLYLTAEPVPWLALLVAAGLLAWWWLSRWLAAGVEQLARPRRVSRPVRGIIFGLGLVLALVVGGLVLSRAAPQGLMGGDGSPTGGGALAARLELWGGAFQLALEFPFTGGGLAAFPGLYSQYILIVPYYFISSSHNLFLDVAVEQGLLGLLALGIIFAVSARRLLRVDQDRETGPLRAALLAGLLVAVLHGMAENALYGGWDTLLLLALPGLAVGVSAVRPVGEAGQRGLAPLGGLAPVVGVALLLLGGFFARDRLAGSLYANLGAVHMARVELADFPLEAWREGSQVAELAPAVALFNRALEHDPFQRTANYRLGLVALLERDFWKATTHLESAYYQSNFFGVEHRGLRKTLGYSYVWATEFYKAVYLLVYVPEAYAEMDSYARWWHAQGRDDLAASARRVLRILKGIENSFQA